MALDITICDFQCGQDGTQARANMNNYDSRLQSMSALAEKMRARIEQAAIPISDDKTLRVTVSIGVAMHAGHPDYSHLINQADTALYEAKRTGRNRVVQATA